MRERENFNSNQLTCFLFFLALTSHPYLPYPNVYYCILNSSYLKETMFAFSGTNSTYISFTHNLTLPVFSVKTSFHSPVFRPPKYTSLRTLDIDFQISSVQALDYSCLHSSQKLLLFLFVRWSKYLARKLYNNKNKKKYSCSRINTLVFLPYFFLHFISTS